MLKKILSTLFETNPKLAYFFTGASCVCAIGVVLFLFSYVSTTDVVRAQTARPQSHASKAILEVHIANTGLAFLQGVKVVSVDGTHITVTTSWNQVTFTWVIETNESYYGTRHFGTNFLDSRGGRVSIDSIQPGDNITVTGTLDTNHTDVPTIQADVIRTSS